MLREFPRYWRERWELRRRIAEELRFHTEQAIDEKIADGMTPEEAERSARARLGNRLFITQQCLAAVGLDTLPSAVVLKRIPAAGWAVAAVVLPTLLAAVLIPHHFRELPVAAERLAVSAKSHERAFTIAKHAPEVAAAFRRMVAHIGAEDVGQAVVGRSVSSNFFSLQDATPALGLGFSDSGQPEIILSHRLWEEALGGDPGVVGRELEVNGEPYRVAGIMPKPYWFLHRVDRFWLRSAAYRGRRGRGALLVATDALEAATEGLKERSAISLELMALESASRRPVQVARAIVSAALVFLLLLGLVQTVSLFKALGEKRVPLGLLLRNFAFLFAKTLPVLIATATLWIASVESELLSPSSFFSGVSGVMGTFIFALSAVAAAWYSLVDQRLRCPMCLRKLSMPVPFGIIGSILFDLPGTEYICTYGHGTLYVPEPTSEGLRESRWKEPVGIWAEMLGSSPARLG